MYSESMAAVHLILPFPTMSVGISGPCDPTLGQRVYTLRAELTGHTDNILGLAFSPDSTRLAGGCHDRTVLIWDLANHTAVVLEGHEDLIEGVAWSPDGTRIATGSYDRTLRAWNARAHTEIGVIGLHRDRITDVEWMPAGHQVLTASFDGTARIWPVDIDLDDLRSRARARAYRSLTPEERSAHLLPPH